MKFIEAHREKTFTELLGNKNFLHHLDKTISSDSAEALIEGDLQDFLSTQSADTNYPNSKMNPI